MAPKRNRTTSTDSIEQVTDNVVLPSEQVSETQSILQKFQELEERNRKQDELIKTLSKQVAFANGDISEEAKDAKRKYGYELDGHTRRKEESFEYGYRVLVDNRKEKVVIKTETIGRPVQSTNYNTGKKTTEHNITVTFHDGSTVEMDAIEYIEQFYVVKQIVPDSDIAVIDGKKHYTFRTDKFWTFTIAENFIN